MARTALSESEIKTKLLGCPGWELRSGALYRELLFSDFTSAFGFMTSAALVSEKLDHHPDWANAYNRVTISLMTHDAKGITETDFEWIKRVSTHFSK